MTKPQPRKPRPAKQEAAGHPLDACEMLLAELRERRQRLQQLLGMIQLEASRAAQRRTASSRPKCTGAHKPR